VKNAVTGYSQSMLRRRNRIWFDSSLPCLRRSSSVALGGRYPGFHSASGTSVISAMYFPLGGHLPCEDSDLKSDSVMWNVMLMVCTPCGALACGTRWLRVRRGKLFFRRVNLLPIRGNRGSLCRDATMLLPLVVNIHSLAGASSRSCPAPSPSGLR